MPSTATTATLAAAQLRHAQHNLGKASVSSSIDEASVRALRVLSQQVGQLAAQLERAAFQIKRAEERRILATGPESIEVPSITIGARAD